MLRIFAIIVGVAVLVACAYGGAILWFDGERIRSTVEDRLMKKHGILLEVQEVERSLALRPVIRIRGLRVANSKKPEEPLIEVDRASFRVYPLSFLIGPATLDGVDVDGLRITVPVGDGGALYWDPLVSAMSEWWHRFDWSLKHFVVTNLESEARHVERGDDGLIAARRIEGAIPRPEDIRVVATGVEADLETTLPFDVKGKARLQRLELGRRDHEMPVTLTVDGKVEDKKLSIEAYGGNLLAGDPEERDPLRATVRLGDTTTRIRGTMSRDHPMHLALVVNFDMPAAADREAISVEFGISDPANNWRLTGLRARRGDASVTGNLDFGLQGDRRFVEGDLTLQNVVYPEPGRQAAASDTDQQDAGEPAAAGSAEGGAQSEEDADGKKERDLYAKLLDITRKFDASLQVTVRHSTLFHLPFDRLQFDASLDRGKLETKLDPVSLGDAELSATLRITPAEASSEARLDATLRRIPVAALLGRIDRLSGVTGRFDGDITLSAAGQDSDGILDSLDGRVVLYMEDGSMPDELATKISGDVLAAVFSDFDADDRAPVRCAIADFVFEEGVARPENAMADTGEVKLFGRGEIDFGERRVDIELLPYAKDFSLVSMRVPIRIEGEFDRVKVDLDVSEGVATLLTPIEFGSKDARCETPEVLAAQGSAGAASTE